MEFVGIARHDTLAPHANRETGPPVIGQPPAISRSESPAYCWPRERG
jgi:hypothetical protein